MIFHYTVNDKQGKWSKLPSANVTLKPNWFYYSVNVFDNLEGETLIKNELIPKNYLHVSIEEAVDMTRTITVEV